MTNIQGCPRLCDIQIAPVTIVPPDDSHHRLHKTTACFTPRMRFRLLSNNGTRENRQAITSMRMLDAMISYLLCPEGIDAYKNTTNTHVVGGQMPQACRYRNDLPYLCFSKTIDGT